MSSTRFSLRSFGHHLKNTVSREPDSLPELVGIPEEMAVKFLRVMRASDMSEIEDITDEDIVFLLSHGDVLSDMIELDNILSGNGSMKGRLLSMKSVLKRRIL